MYIRDRAKQLLSKKAIIGWVALIKVFWDSIDNISTIESVVKYMSVVWDFISSSTGNIVLLSVGFGLVLWAVLRTPKTDKQVNKQSTSSEESFNAMAKQINDLVSEVNPYREILKLQEEHEEQWLRPVIEWIDFKREQLPSNQIMLKYQIDSGLVYDFKPYRMWLKLKIGTYEPKDGWEVVPTPNFLKCRRSQFASEEFTLRDDDQLKIIEGCRQGLKIAQTLKIILQLREGGDLKVLEGSYSINPYSESPLSEQEIKNDRKEIR